MMFETAMHSTYTPAGRPAISDSAQALRMARLEEKAALIPSRVYDFNSEVEEFLRGNGSLENLVDRFSTAHREFRDTADAAVRAGKLQSAAVETVNSVINQVRQEFAEGMTGMNSGLGLIEQRDASVLEFVKAARARLEKIQTFWETNVLGNVAKETAN